MLTEDKFFQAHDKSRTWQRYCGFLDLSASEFMDIQERLLLEQIDLVADSPLGSTIMKDQKPTSLDEFRRTVPLTTYDDYLPYIGDGQETYLAEKPYYWVHTSYIKGSFKRVPWSQRFAESQIRNVLAGLILSSANCKGDVQLAPGCKILAILPEPPFVSACLAHGLAEQFSVKPIPPLNSSEKKGNSTFRKKIDEALRMALATDVDYIITMSSSFMPMSLGFQRVTENRSFIPMLSRVHPLVFLRLINNNPRRLFSRKGKLSPRDLWSVKGIVVWGSDSNAFSDMAKEQLGRPLFQFYGSSEAGIMAMQDWKKDKMVLLPDSVFFEFLPEEKIGQNDGASTVLLNELEYGKAYEPIISSFHGMPFLRYHQGDLIRISAPEKEGQLPRLEFCKRADDVVDLFGIARLNSKTLLEALDLTGVVHGEWSVRKQYEKNKPVLELHIELGDEADVLGLGNRFHRKLKEVDRHYREAAYMLGYNPIRVSRLPIGSFERYFREVRTNGHGGNGHSQNLHKLPQLNLKDSVIGELIQAGA